MRTYHFEVRETTLRTAQVQASSAAEARAKLVDWQDRGGSFDDDNELGLGDPLSERFTFRSIKPWETE